MPWGLVERPLFPPNCVCARGPCVFPEELSCSPGFSAGGRLVCWWLPGGRLVAAPATRLTWIFGWWPPRGRL
eukprot:13877937-Alexandrium_andersonii.AAC.1